MKYPAGLFIIMMITIVLVGCVPTTDTGNPSEDIPINPTNSITPEPTSAVVEEEGDIELELSDEQEEIQVEPTKVPTEESQADPQATEETPIMPTENLDEHESIDLPQVDTAKADLATRLNISEDEIEVIKVEFVTWRDGSLGCPLPGMMYTQALQDGLKIQLSVNDKTYNYHSGGSRDPFLCEQSLTEKSTPNTPNLDQLITPPSGDDLDK